MSFVLRRLPAALVVVFLLYGSTCLAQVDTALCRIETRQPSSETIAVLERIANRLSIDPSLIHLYETSDPLIKQFGGSSATWCTSGPAIEKEILYDPALLRGKGDMARLFVFAHELAHHAREHLDPARNTFTRLEKEEQADRWAATYLTWLRYTQEQILEGFDALVFPVAASQAYPSRNDRRKQVIAGIIAGHKDDGPTVLGAAVPQAPSGTGIDLSARDAILARLSARAETTEQPVKCAAGCTSTIHDLKVSVVHPPYAYDRDPNWVCDETVYRLPDTWPGGPFLHVIACGPRSRPTRPIINLNLASTDRPHDSDTTILYSNGSGTGLIRGESNGRKFTGPWRVKVLGNPPIESMTIEVRP